ncbi:hypothetical protein BpHYR1_045908 [Brachionus plicatilis]|uniref:Uncharacterized protein n=1 Tax=Brachionus plicatilis TaxID=10195 RepID=A0A3M7S730_BRAPC|nr:hypothetical protein BpHYR1_045908 [Brachionus plicatilis]
MTFKSQINPKVCRQLCQAVENSTPLLLITFLLLFTNFNLFGLFIFTNFYVKLPEIHLSNGTVSLKLVRKIKIKSYEINS